MTTMRRRAEFSNNGSSKSKFDTVYRICKANILVQSNQFQACRLGTSQNHMLRGCACLVEMVGHGVSKAIIVEKNKTEIIFDFVLSIKVGNIPDIAEF